MKKILKRIGLVKPEGRHAKPKGRHAKGRGRHAK